MTNQIPMLIVLHPLRASAPTQLYLYGEGSQPNYKPEKKLVAGLTLSIALMLSVPFAYKG